MSFLENVRRAKAHLEEQRRISLRGLKREFCLDDDALDELAEELVEVQRVAAREGEILVWVGGAVARARREQALGRPDRDPRDYTPKHLADKILGSKSALEGERKQVTVLFADVKGSMELAEQVDPEEWHRILERFFEILTEGVHRFEGTVNQYTGDGIMALFGAPIAHEDHAQRACYAALHLRDELLAFADELRVERNIDFPVRIGLNSGEVVVGKIGDDLRMDYTAQGQVVGVAARLQELARPGLAYLTQPTADLVRGFFELRDLGESAVKGVRAPVRIFELTAHVPGRARFDLSLSRQLSQFVGRERELTLLKEALAKALEGHGQMVAFVGEAGVGKSRMAHEFLETCRARGIRVGLGYGAVHERDVPFASVLRIYRSLFEITPRDSDRQAREKIEGRLLALDAEFEPDLPIFFGFMGVPDPKRPAPRIDPEGLRRQHHSFARRLVRAWSRREPSIVLVDDVQWMDRASLGLVLEAIRTIRELPVLYVVTYRPEFAGEIIGHPHQREIRLAPLEAETGARLARALVGSDPSVEELPALIQAQTGGNAFFIEEVVASLCEVGSLEGERGAFQLVRPLQDLAIPPRVRSVLDARIDRLRERDKSLLQAAAVLGKRFSLSVLDRVAELSAEDLTDALRRLVERDFLYQDSLYPDVEYAFKHPITHDAAYQSQLGDRRRRVHADAARALQSLEPERLEERAALIAHHWEAAEAPAEACAWHRRAAEWAAASDLSEALRHWRSVRELAEAVPATERTEPLLAACAGILGVGFRTGLSIEEHGEVFTQGTALAQRAGDEDALALLYWLYGTVLGFSGDEEGRLRHAREAVAIARRIANRPLEIGASVTLMWSLFFLGDLHEAWAIAPTDDEHAFAMGRGIILAYRGHLREGARELQEAAALERKQDNMELFGWVEGYRAEVACMSGDAGAAQRHAHVALETARAMGSTYTQVLALRMLGAAHLLARRWQEAVSVLEEGLVLAREERAGRRWEPYLLTHLADARLAIGHPDARTSAEAALDLARRRKLKLAEGYANVTLARTLIRAQDLPARAEVEGTLARAAELVDETGAECQRAWIYQERAALAQRFGDEPGCRRHLREAHRLFAETGAEGHAERVARELAEPEA